MSVERATGTSIEKRRIKGMEKDVTYEIFACPCLPGLDVDFEMILQGWFWIRIWSPLASEEAWVGVVREASADVEETSWS